MVIVKGTPLKSQQVFKLNHRSFGFGKVKTEINENDNN
jgi:hypothetical protein